MRFELYKVEITRADRPVTGYVVASDEQRASEIVVEHEIGVNQQNQGFTLERVDETLPNDQRKGLDVLLESAPAGIASWCEPLGWITHAEPVHKLHLFRIEEIGGEDRFIIAPSADVAARIHGVCAVGPDNAISMFRIHDGLVGLRNEALRGLPALLEFGPVGMVSWDDKSGWSLD
ncbi:hypothetical protein G6N82_10345 [Altererythrobacter sp. BO-6]|uniref:hypothetical protein n=1 Tax=Altererythrobacter sp. BO-6 TaxID=2604537 RepID=UPI0013E1AD8D|nr:hypothetical protein [Altererythrobacter sp. BO-6]QIG54497.1 hypothetical protein G6N82_10345 [Altererythrobacter sp. BO-6]